MDDLLNTLGGFSVTNHANNPNAEHPHFSLYKFKSSGSSQNERRRRVLEARKEARYDLLMHLRQIEEGDGACEGDDDEMDYRENPSACYARPRRYKNFVMLSEWLVDVPEDFATSYVAVLCPVGKRCIVVASRGVTRAYARNGALIKEFYSLLPNGGPAVRHSSGYIVIDCIWSERTNTFFVFDLVVWGRQAMADCETILRFEFLKSRMSELDHDASVVTPKHPHRFVVVPYTDCSVESLTAMLANDAPFIVPVDTDSNEIDDKAPSSKNVPVDGVLFYHSESHYTHGPTPLVGWLKPYMFKEILNIDVPPVYQKDMPTRYTTLPQYIEYAKEQRERAICKRNAEKEQMEVSSSTTTELSAAAT